MKEVFTIYSATIYKLGEADFRIAWWEKVLCVSIQYTALLYGFV